MEVILKQDVAKLGKSGSVVNVKEGFARNFLIPNGLAVVLNSANLKKLEAQMQARLQQAQKEREQVEKVKNRLTGLSLTITASAHDDDKLYGSINSQEILRAIKDEGIELDKNTIILEEPIRSLGIYEIPVKLHPEVSTKIKVWIVKK